MATVLLLVALWRMIAPSPYRGRGIIAMLCVGASMWCVGSVLLRNDSVPTHVAAALTQAAVGVCVGAGLMAAHAISVMQNERQALWIRAVLLAEPPIIAALTYFQVGVSPGEDFRYSTVHLAHLIYVFAVAMSIIVTLSSRQYAPGRGSTILLYALQFLLVGLTMAEVLGSDLGCLIAGTVALIVASISTHPDDVFVLATTRREILDGLGAYVFVFDREGLLKDWNGPAEQLISHTGRPALRRGTTATKVLGTPVPFTDDHVITFQTTDGTLDLQGYTVEASSDERERGYRWIVVLQNLDQARRPFDASEEPRFDAATHTLSRPAIIERLRNAAADPNKPVAMRVDVVLQDIDNTDRVMARVAGRLLQLCPTLQIGRIERLALAAIVPSRVNAQDLSAQVTFDDDLRVPLVATVVKPADEEDVDDFVRQVLTPAHIDGERRWQPKWY